MNDSRELIEALAILDAAGGRLSVQDGRLRVDVEIELPDAVWRTITSHRDELLATVAGDRPIWPETAEPIWRDRLGERDLLPLPDGVDRCDRCRSTDTVDQTIHNGQSVRRDCAVCGRFRKFTIWYGVPMP